VHDLSFLRHPEFFRRGNRTYLQRMTGPACRRAAAVVTVSDFTAREVEALLDVPAERIHTVYHGVDPRFHPLPRAEVEAFRREEGLPERFVLYLGTLEPRKNLVTLVRAFHRLPDPDLHLVLAGGKGWLYEEVFAEVERLGLSERVHFPGYVPAETQALWYSAAEAFAYLSHYEGFGLPVLEALACGVPTLTGNTTSLPEAAGDGALLVDPEEVGEVVEGLARLLRDEGLREELRAQGVAHARRFTWAETARRTAAVYRHVLGVGEMG
jgi:glycosyltransferase involved in cell wall biosynthesis